MSYDYQTIHDLQKQISELTEFKSKAIGTVAEVQAENRELKRKLDLCRNALEMYAGHRSSEWRLSDNGEIAEAALDAVKKKP